MGEDAVTELAGIIGDAGTVEAWEEVLRREDDIQASSVKIANGHLRDSEKHRQRRGSPHLADQEQETRGVATSPINLTSLSALSPTGKLHTEADLFELNREDVDGDGEGDSNNVRRFSAPPREYNFAVLNSSLLGPQKHSQVQLACTKWTNLPDHKEIMHTGWQFGIQSRSSPMKMMTVLYASLKALGMQWRERLNLGGLCEGNSDSNGHRAGDIYLIESRARYQDIVVLMNIKLYYVQNDAYLVDFHHVRSYRASTEPGAGKFDTDKPFLLADSSSDTGNILPQDPKVEEIYSPHAFMDVALNVITKLARGSV